MLGEAAGINVTLEIAPSDGFWSEVWLVEPFYTSTWQERPADEILNQAWRSTAKWNESYFQNPDYDQLLDEARGELGFDTRRDIYHAAQPLIAEEGGSLIRSTFYPHSIHTAVAHYFYQVDIA